MIRLFYNEQGDIMYAITKEASVDLGLPFIDCEDDNIKINKWRIDTENKTLVYIE